MAVLAAFSPVPRGRSFDFLSGTSMAAPHVAGAAALFFGKHPTWSPMAVKSAMMTTSARVKNADGSMSVDYYAQGAGNVRPSAMFNPGLVLESGVGDWLGFIEGAGADEFDEVEPIDPSDYNSPSIAIGSLVGTQTVTREVTAVKAGQYRASVAVPGVTATVTPATVSFSGPGETKTIEVTFTRQSAPLSQAAFGSLILQSSEVTVRLPIAVTPQAVDAPDTVTGSGAAGSVSFPVKAGFNGAFPITARGLAAGDVQQGEVSADDAGRARRAGQHGAGRDPGGPVEHRVRRRHAPTSTWRCTGSPTVRWSAARAAVPGWRASPCSTRSRGVRGGRLPVLRPGRPGLDHVRVPRLRGRAGPAEPLGRPGQPDGDATGSRSP